MWQWHKLSVSIYISFATVLFWNISVDLFILLHHHSVQNEIKPIVTSCSTFSMKTTMHFFSTYNVTFTLGMFLGCWEMIHIYTVSTLSVVCKWVCPLPVQGVPCLVSPESSGFPVTLCRISFREKWTDGWMEIHPQSESITVYLTGLSHCKDTHWGREWVREGESD